jgi:hypothetical protein
MRSPDAGHAAGGGVDAHGFAGDERGPCLLGAAPRVREHRAGVGVAVVGPEDAETHVAQVRVGDAGAHLRRRELLDARAGRPHRLEAPGQPLFVRVRREEQVAALDHPRREVHGQARLHERHVDGVRELLADAPHRPPRRRALERGIALEEHDAPGPGLGQVQRRAGAHDAAADHDHVRRAGCAHACSIALAVRAGVLACRRRPCRAGRRRVVAKAPRTARRRDGAC